MKKYIMELENRHMEKINLSVIIPHYNTPALLKKLIDSIPILNDIQIIVVDDNSDEELEKFSEIKDLYKKRVEFYENDTGVRSAGSCRNIGLEYAKGDWVLFADADDYFLPDMYKIIQDYFTADYDMVYFTPMSVFMDTGKTASRHMQCKILIQNYLNNPNEKNAWDMKFCFVQPWSKLIKRDTIEKYHIRFSQSLYSNDIFFSTIIGYYSKNIAASREVIYCTTRRSGSLTMHIDENVYDIRLEEKIKRWKFLIEHYGIDTCKKQYMTSAGCLYTAFQRHYGIKKYIEVIRKLKKSHIPILYLKLFCPTYFLKKLFYKIRIYKQDEKYYVRTNYEGWYQIGKRK